MAVDFSMIPMQEVTLTPAQLKNLQVRMAITQYEAEPHRENCNCQACWDAWSEEMQRRFDASEI